MLLLLFSYPTVGGGGPWLRRTEPSASTWTKRSPE